MTVSTTGSAALAAVLDPIAAEINEELAALKTLFVEELMPRAKRVGDALRKARANFGTNAHFYEWSEQAVGIKERQVRTYLRFADRLPAIEAAAEAEGAKITSMEQGLALLAPAKPQEERTEQELAVAAMAVSTGRAVGAIGRAIEGICEIAPGGLSSQELLLLQNASDLLRRWGSITPDDASNITPPTTVDVEPLAVDRQPEWEAETPEPTNQQLEQRLQQLDAQAEELLAQEATNDLPMDQPLKQWTLAQLEEGIARYDSQAGLAKELGVTRAGVNGALKRLRKAAGLID